MPSARHALLRRALALPAFLPSAPFRLTLLSRLSPARPLRRALRPRRAMATPPLRHFPPPSAASPPSASAALPPSPPGPTHGARARLLCARARAATLSTLDRESGAPYGTLAAYALLACGDVVLLVSELAEHTRNLRADGRCSVCVAEEVGGGVDPLARERVTLVGVAAVVDRGGEEEAECRGVFLERNGAARRYVGFGDFSFWRVRLEKVRYIGGFGRMSFVGVEEWAAARTDPVAVDERVERLVARCNQPERVRGFVGLIEGMGAVGVTGVRVRGVDRLGIEMDVGLRDGGQPMRIGFERPADGLEDAESLLEALLGGKK